MRLIRGEIHARTPTHTRLHTHTSSSSIYSHTHTRTHSNLEQPRTASPLLSTTRRQYNIGSIISSGYAPVTPLLLSFCLLLYLSFLPLTSYFLLLTSYFLLLTSYSPFLLQFPLLSSFLVYFIFTPLLLSFSLLLSFFPPLPLYSLTSYSPSPSPSPSPSLLQFLLLSSFQVYFICTLG